MNDGLPPRLDGFAPWPDADSLTDLAIRETFVDPLNLESFWFQWYLEGFVDQGYGKLKCLLGRPGSGKTHLLRHLRLAAKEAGYQTAQVDASRVKIAAIEELYRAVADQVDWQGLLAQVLRYVIQGELGYPEFSGNPREFIAWGENTRQLMPNLLRRDLREAIDRYLRRVDWHPEFSMVVRAWMNEQVSDVMIDESVAVTWLRAEKLGASLRKSLGVRSNVTRRNARGLLTSLASLAHKAFGKGLLILIDNVQVIASSVRVEGRPYYTRGARDQAYEMFREMIDESPFTPYLMTILAGDIDPLSNARTGFPSYPALWARLETEVQSPEANRFADLVYLDALWEQDEESLHQLVFNWRDTPVERDKDLIPSEQDEVVTMGLEWGRPRRLVAQLWAIRGHGEGEQA